ncbi:MAG: helicase RepA family protein [Defluviitaleaceae bacterium]|nr:helicase RepA family protein [Defluviitaleaceae bacterium]
MSENKISDKTPNDTTPKEFSIIDGNTLMAQEYESLGFSVEKILPHGIFILAGSGKIGKSWLALDMAVSVATGGSLWDFGTGGGTVLYLALEDNYPRLQDRLITIDAKNKDISKLKLTTASCGIKSGLFEQANSFFIQNPDTKLIIIDTMEKIRDTQMSGNIYSHDYRDMTLLRELTKDNKLTVLLIHHTRKLSDDDPLNTLSGSMGLVGASDGVFVLEKEKRTGTKAKLTIANRDTQGFCFMLELATETCKWQFLGNEGDLPPEIETIIEEKDEWLYMLIDDFLEDDWRGTCRFFPTEGANILNANLFLTIAHLFEKLLMGITSNIFSITPLTMFLRE